MLGRRCALGILVVGQVLLTRFAQANEQSALFDSARAFGRGRTYVAAYDSDEASRLNPATLGEGKISYQLRLAQADTFIGSNTLNTVGDLVQVVSSGEIGLGFLKKFDKKFGKRQFAKAQLSLFSMRFGQFEISPVGVNTSWLELDNDRPTNMRWLSDTLAGLNLSYGFELGKDVAVGLTLRPAYRWYIAGTIDFVDLLSFLPPSTAQFQDFTPIVSGTLVAVDLGFVWKPHPDFRWGLVAQNLGDAAYTQSSGTQPPAMQQLISTGFLLRSRLSSAFDLDYFVDVQDLTNRQGLNLTRLVKGGMELGSRLFSRDHDFGLTAGINEGYLSAGLFLDLYVLRLDVASYGVELGQTPGQRLDRRLAFSGRTSLTF